MVHSSLTPIVYPYSNGSYPAGQTPVGETISYELLAQTWHTAASDVSNVWSTYLTALVEGNAPLQEFCLGAATTILETVADEVQTIITSSYDVRLFIHDASGLILSFGGTAAEGNLTQLRADVVLAFLSATTQTSTRFSVSTKEFTTYFTSGLSRFDETQPDMFSHVLRVSIGRHDSTSSTP